MVRIVIDKNVNGKIIGLTSSGHAGFDVYGKDIVCAAVSVLLQTAVLGLQLRLGESRVRVEVDKDKGRLRCLLPVDLSDKEREQADVIFETMLAGLLQIHDQYPKHIAIVENIVNG